MTDRNTNEVSDEMLMALADGELDDAQAAVLRARIAADPDLAARHAVFADTAAALRAAFATDAVPRRLIDAVEGTPTDGGRDTGKVLTLPRRALAWPAALAASLALGIGLGWGLKGTAPVSAPGLAEVAQAVSDLPTGAAADVAGVGGARVLGSFDTQRGLCRLIAVEPSQGDRARFVACRADGGWDVALSLTDDPGDGFTPASGAATEVIDLYLDSLGASAALDPDTEAQALHRVPE